MSSGLYEMYLGYVKNLMADDVSKVHFIYIYVYTYIHNSSSMHRLDWDRCG